MPFIPLINYSFSRTYCDYKNDYKNDYFDVYENIVNQQMKSLNSSHSENQSNNQDFISMQNKCKESGSNKEELTHVDTDGAVNMVNIGNKIDSHRYASAECFVILSPSTFKLVKENKMKKGDVLTVAQIAGLLAAKRTSSLIPLCHNINLNKIDVELSLDELNNRVVISSKVECFGKTGVEMESLVCVSVAALTVYDMCKSAGHDITITEIKLIKKIGGKSDYH